MTVESIRTVAVLGAGIMGQGIARVCAAAGLTTQLYDIDESLIQRGIAAIESATDLDLKKGKITEEAKDGIMNHLRGCAHLEEVMADLVIEAVVEKIDVKKRLFRELDNASKKRQRFPIMATDTSSLSVSRIASVLADPARCLGLHFFNPADRMKLVEVVAGDRTAPDLIAVMLEFSKKLGKTPVLAKDSPGFIVNRVARPYYVESLRVLENSVTDVAGIDALLRSAGFKMGPFELMDLIGIDINYSVTSSLYYAFQEAPKFKPSRIQEEKMSAGHLGRKTGKGFYDYEKN